MSFCPEIHLIHLFLGSNHAFSLYVFIIFNGLVNYKDFLCHQHLLFLWKCFKNKVLQMSWVFLFFSKNEWPSKTFVLAVCFRMRETKVTEPGRRLPPGKELYDESESETLLSQAGLSLHKPIFMERRVWARLSQFSLLNAHSLNLGRALGGDGW